MGLGSFFKSVGSTISSGAKTVGKAVSSKVSSVASTVASKASTVAKVVGTNVKNSFSADSLKAFANGFAQGGLVGAIGAAAMTTSIKSMEELDKSGKWNDAYAYKQYGFPDKETFDTACAYGITDYGQWQAFVSAAEETYGGDYSDAYAGSVVVTPENGGSASVATNGGLTVVTQSSAVSAVSDLKAKYDADTVTLKNTVVRI